MRWLRRLWCVLFGCGVDHNGYCPRCGEHIYEGWHYVQYELSKLHPLRKLWWRVQWQVRWWTVGRRCDVCGRRFWRRELNWCCSDACYEQWIPF